MKSPESVDLARQTNFNIVFQEWLMQTEFKEAERDADSIKDHKEAMQIAPDPSMWERVHAGESAPLSLNWKSEQTFILNTWC